MKQFFRYFLGLQSPLQFMIGLKAKGCYIGQDYIGNQYYRGKPRRGYKNERRWVVYKSGNTDGSEVPPEFHGWLHHQTDTFPNENSGYRKAWIKPYEPNKTGTTLAYKPPGYDGKRAKVTGDYEAWTPE